MAEKISLDDLLESFHNPKKWAHPRKPTPVFVIINKFRKIPGVTEDDLFWVTKYLHQSWDEPNVWGRAIVELRRVHGKHAQEDREAERKSFVEAADRLMGEIDGR